MRPLRWTCLCLVSALTLPTVAGLPLLAADPPPPSIPQEPFGESIDVRVVNVEAVVTDRKGERVRGLKPSDFRLLVDGRELPIDYFTEIDGGTARTAGPAAAPAAPEAAAAPAPAPAIAPGERVPTNYLVYIDDQFSIPAQRNVVLRRLAKDLDRIVGPGDQMAVLSFEGHRIDRLSDWTGDHKALADAFTQAQERPGFGVGLLAERRSETSSDLIQESGPAALTLFDKAQIGIRAVVAAMRGTPAPPGRKVLLFLNGGWGIPELPQQGGLPSAVDLPDEEKIYAPVFDTANLLGYTLYPVDVQGMDPESTWADARQAAPVDHPFITTSYERSVHTTLEVLARETGGKAILNSARLDALPRVAQDTRSYYWLGFSPQWKADGSRHDVRLEVRRPGLAVRSRTGYTDLRREDEAQLQTASLLLYGGQSPEPLAVTLGEVRKAGVRRFDVPLTVEMRGEDLTPLPDGEGGWMLAANVFFCILDSGTLDGSWKTLPVRLRAKEVPPPGTRVEWPVVLKVSRSTRRMLVALGADSGGVLRWTRVDLKKEAATEGP